jgi:ribonuclease BN (tRNA processing enzyme)
VPHPSIISRRAFLTSTVTIAAGSGFSGTRAQRSGTRLILLGTGGGPRPRTTSSASAQVIVGNNVAYVIDCGDGVARQLAFAGVPLPTLRHVFITHQHSDHNADYGNLIWLAWAAGLNTRVDTWGPPPLEKMTALFFEMNAYDIETRIANEGRPALRPLVHVHELREGGAVMSDENLRVAAALVDHAPVVPAFAYRFDARDRSIVISGDTAPSDNLVKLARDADVLVHSVMYPSAIDRLVTRVPNAAALKASILAHQTSAEDAGRIAQAARVKTLVLSHFVPPDDPAITDAMWRDAAQRHFRGTVMIGKDLLEI